MNTPTRKALLARINRKLSKKDQYLRTSRSWAERQAYGDFCVIDTRKNQALLSHVNPEARARELGLLPVAPVAHGVSHA